MRVQGCLELYVDSVQLSLHKRESPFLEVSVVSCPRVLHLLFYAL